MDSAAFEKLPKPRQLGPYTLYGKLGASGLATVFVGRSKERWFAIKCLHAHLADDPLAMTIFHEERRILERLKHPNLCGVVDAGVHDKTPYLATPYLHGVQLRVFLERYFQGQTSLPLQSVLRMVHDLAEGLHYAHELKTDVGQPLVHRDISPENIMIPFEGPVQLLDFGVASIFEDTRVSRAVQLKGKFAYMAPEQVLGQVADRRADIYALGVVLWECLAGRTLFSRSSNAQTLSLIEEREAPRVDTVRPGLPFGLALVVHQAIANRPEHRFTTGSRFARALAPFLESETGQSISKTAETIFPECVHPDGLLNPTMGDEETQRLSFQRFETFHARPRLTGGQSWRAEDATEGTFEDVSDSLIESLNEAADQTIAEQTLVVPEPGPKAALKAVPQAEIAEPTVALIDPAEDRHRRQTMTEEAPPEVQSRSKSAPDGFPRRRLIAIRASMVLGFVLGLFVGQCGPGI